MSKINVIATYVGFSMDATGDKIRAVLDAAGGEHIGQGSFIDGSGADVQYWIDASKRETVERGLHATGGVNVEFEEVERVMNEGTD